MNPTIDIDGNTDIIWRLSRSRLVGNGRTIPLERLGQGKFCRAYRMASEPTRAILIVNDSYHDKEILTEAHRHNPNNPHIPAVSQFGLTAEDTIYSAPVYHKLTPNSVDAWADWLKIRRAMKAARKLFDEMQSNREWHRRNNEHDGCYLNQYFIDEAPNFGIDGPLLEALEEICYQAQNYGSDVWMEFRPGNLGVDDAGRLVLIDPTFNMTQLRARDKKRAMQTTGQTPRSALR